MRLPAAMRVLFLRHGFRILSGACLLLLTALPLRAQNLESALMPGAVVKQHADIEHDCGQCHVRGNRAAQPDLCLACHKAVAADVRSHQGWHGRQQPLAACRTCHTEHKGREARIAGFDAQRFDHRQTDFALKGKHTTATCASCHREPANWSKAPADCAACHRKDDRHKGALGAQCANCHDETGWKDGRFDHGRTRFALRHAHARARCDDCHGGTVASSATNGAAPRYAGTPRACVGCHRKDDAHKGSLGTACEKCHAESAWRQSSFNHDRDTRFALTDRHRPLQCASCHRNPPAQEKLAMACVACHRGDDVHPKQLAADCAGCHSAKGWKDARFDHERDAAFALRERHARLECAACHATGPTSSTLSTLSTAAHAAAGPASTRGKHQRLRSTTPVTCVGCHDKDDRERGHRGNFGKDCASCHDQTKFKPAHFEHNAKTNFRLANKHAVAACIACHTTPLYTSTTETRCVACHRKDDDTRGHRGGFGERCETCHDDRGFSNWHFTHADRAQFPAGSKHEKARCATCHTASLVPAPPEPRRCVACHAQDDVHLKSYDSDCAACHVAADWRRIVKREGALPSLSSSGKAP